MSLCDGDNLRWFIL